MLLDVNNLCNLIEPELTTFIHNIITLLKIAVPIILVIFGMLDFGKGVLAGKEDEIKKGQHNFIKRLIAGAVVFFMVAIAQLITGIIDRESNGEIWNCANAIMNGENIYSDNNENDEEKEELKQERVNEAIRQCCISAGGEVVDGKSSSGEELTSCKLVNDTQTETYNQCFNENVKPIQSGVK